MPWTPIAEPEDSPSEPGFLLIEVQLAKFVGGLGQVDDPLNQPDDRHHPSGDATGHHTTGKAHHQHDDAGVVVAEHKLVDPERAQKDPQQSSRQFLVADLGFS